MQIKNCKVISQEGFLEFEKGNEIRCVVVEDTETGEKIRVISSSGMFKAFHRTPHGRKTKEGLPAAIGANNIVKYVPEEDRAIFTEYKYIIGKKEFTGYNANVIPVICDAYLEAEKNEDISTNQFRSLEYSKIILRSLAKVGINALIDEATGFQYEREINALQQLLKLYVSEDVMRWQSRFPRDYYEEIYRLYGWEFDPENTKRPQCIGNFTNKYVYDLLPEEVMKEIKTRNPVKKSVNNKKIRAKKHHQYLTQDIGIPQLDKHVSTLITTMRISDDMEDFKSNYKRAFKKELKLKESRENTQLEF